MKALDTSDYRGQSAYNWAGSREDEEDGYPLYVQPGSARPSLGFLVRADLFLLAPS
jgi:hypothetical protein